MTIKNNHVFIFSEWSKPLTYLVGVYLSDGSVHKPEGRMAIFTHSSIDKEYVDKTESALRVIVPLTNIRRREMNRVEVSENSVCKRFSGTIYEVTISNDDFGVWLQTATKNKTVIPDLPKEYLADLLSAFIDGDGYISLFKDKKRPINETEFLACYQAGFCGKGPKMRQIKEAFESLGVKIGSKTVGQRDVETYKINLATLAETKVCFSIHRKFFKYCQYVNQVKPSTTIRRTLSY